MSLFVDLGLENTCTLEDVKKAYKKLAIIHHPDKGGDTATFHKIQTAYETLSDPQKRAHYEANLNGGGAFFDLNSLFARMGINFNQARRKLPDEHLNVEVRLEVALTETLHNSKRTVNKSCCFEMCTRCKGQGHIMTPMRNGQMITTSQMTCSLCSGKGRVYKPKESGSTCCTNGYCLQTYDLVLPIVHSVIFFEKLGKQPSTFLEEASNLYIHLVILPDNPYLSVDKSDLVYKPPLTIRDMMLGCEVVLPAELKHEEAIKIEPLTLLPNYCVVIPNKGLFTSTSRGNIRVCPVVDYTIDKSQVNMEALAQVFIFTLKN